MLWAAALAALLDGRLRRSAVYFTVCAACSFFGIVHSPLADPAIGLPWQVLPRTPWPDSLAYQTPYHWTATYLLAVGLLLGLSFVHDKAQTASI